MDAVEETANRARGTAGQAVDNGSIHDQPPEVDGHEEHPGGGRFNQRLLIVFVGVAMIVGVVTIQGFVRRA